MMRDRVAARASLQRVLQWDFDRVIVTHGEILEHGGRQAMQSAREVRLLATDAGLEYQTAVADLERALGGPVR